MSYLRGDCIETVGLAVTLLRQGGMRYSFNIPGSRRRNGVSEGLEVLPPSDGCVRVVGLTVLPVPGGRAGRVGLAVVSERGGGGGGGGVTELTVLSLRGSRGETVGVAVLYLRGRRVGRSGLAVFSLRGGRVGGAGLAVLYVRGSRIDGVGLGLLYVRGARIAGVGLAMSAIIGRVFEQAPVFEEQAGTPPVIAGDCTALRSALGWIPHTDLESGLRQHRYAMQACDIDSTFEDYAAMASGRGSGSEIEPATEPAETAQK